MISRRSPTSASRGWKSRTSRVFGALSVAHPRSASTPSSSIHSENSERRRKIGRIVIAWFLFTGDGRRRTSYSICVSAVSAVGGSALVELPAVFFLHHVEDHRLGARMDRRELAPIDAAL